VAAEGVGFNVPIVGSVARLARTFDRWFNKPLKPSRGPTAQEQRDMRARALGYASAAAIPVFQRSLPTRAGVFQAAQAGVPPGAQQPPSTAEQILDAAIRGVQRGYELRELLVLLLGLFRKEPRVPGMEGFYVPYLTIPTPGGVGGGALSGTFDWGSVGQGIAAIIQAFKGGQAQAMPGGAPFSMPIPGSLNLPSIFAPSFGGVVGGSSTTAPAGCPSGSPFSGGGMVARPSTFFVPNPVTGKLTWFKPAGQPLLWSGDLSAAKRVRRVARLAKRRAGGR
jgi:hypothetical protein